MRSGARISLAASAVAALLALAAVACQQDLEQVSQVSKLRVLAVQTDPPEASPGEAVGLRVLTADPAGDGRPIVAGGVAVSGLVTPSASEIEEPELFWPLAPSAAGEDGVVDLGSLGIPPDAGEVIPPEEGSLPATAIVLICAGGGQELAGELTDALLEGFGSIDLEDPAAITELCQQAGAEEGLVAFKTFDMSALEPGDPNRNLNPRIGALYFDKGAGPVEEGGGSDYACTGSDGCREGVLLQVYLTEDSFQQYEKEVFGQTEVADERNYVSWFVSGGSFTQNRSGNNGEPSDPFEVEWLPPREGGEFDLWVVAHDIRGGVSWRAYRVSAE
ncbi:MAG: hypothetical protein R6V85_05780 [Polyangia bacterium]